MPPRILCASDASLNCAEGRFVALLETAFGDNLIILLDGRFLKPDPPLVAVEFPGECQGNDRPKTTPPSLVSIDLPR